MGCQAEACRQQRLRNATEGDETFAGILSRLGVGYEGEKIVLNGDRWGLLDFFIASVNLAIELDGEQHKVQRQYDHGRSMWIARQGIKTARSRNGAVMNGQAEEKARQMLGLSAK